MARGKSITLKGAAARAFVEGAAGKPLGGDARKELTTGDKYLVLATRIALHMKSGTEDNAKIACAILAQLEVQGLEKAYEAWRN